MHLLLFLVALVGMVLSTLPADAQNNIIQINASAAAARDLNYPTSPTAISAEARMGLHKPDGAGPFPAIVLHHQCAGLQAGPRSNVSMVSWAKEAIKRGYVVLQLDSMASRGVDSVCVGPKGGVNVFRGAKDALQGADFLRGLPYVDGKRIAHVGFSWGAMVALIAGGKLVHDTLAPGNSFAASVAFYPGCFTFNPPSAPKYEIVRSDIDRPVLILMGDKDTETPIADCIPRLTAAKIAGAPIDWHVYSDTTHCWDCSHLDNFTKVDARGAKVLYRYNAAITSDSMRRTFEYLESKMPKI